MDELRAWSIATIELALPLLLNPTLPTIVAAFAAGVSLAPCEKTPWLWQVARAALAATLIYIGILIMQSLAAPLAAG